MSISFSSSLLQAVFNSSHGEEKMPRPTGFWLENFSGTTQAIVFTALGVSGVPRGVVWGFNPLPEIPKF
jgi:hypothetical protein